MKTKITNISKLYTWNIHKNILEIKNNKEILIKDDIIIEIADEVGNADKIIDADNKIITPGFIDTHTHPIFIGNRANELILRSEGKSYEQISKLGGGILSSVNSLRSASFEKLYKSSYNNILPFIYNGTTTLEAKSGYGLSIEDELKSLEVIKELNKNLKIDIVPTFLGAHDFPEEYKNDKEKYIDIICNEMIPEISEKKLARFCDVFCEEGYFDYEQSKKILNTAKKYNILPRMHADEFKYSKASELAAEINALSADHLMAVNDDGIRALSKSEVISTLLPGTTFFLNKNNYANGRNLIDNGCRVAIATDFNPGTCTIKSLPFIMFLAINKCGLKIEESFLAVTYNAAISLGLENNIGLIKKGYKADIICWDIESLDEIPYWFENNKISFILKNGLIIN